MLPMLTIKDLSVSFAGKPLLKNINLSISDGARHLLSGHNGSGKTSLAKAIAGDADYHIDNGQILFDGTDITNLPTADRARLGIFFGLQHVPEIPGLSITSFLKHSMMSHDPNLTAGTFFNKLTNARTYLNIPENWLGRSLNVGFSGGEKKKIMFLHMLLARPRLAILDEPDSGVDADTQKLFASLINELNQNKTTFLIISHQEGFTKLINPTATTVLSNGNIVI